jgi:hypothetical protein
MYKLVRNALTNEITSIFRIEDSVFIPCNLINSDYVVYLAWLADGNVPLPPIEG